MNGNCRPEEIWVDGGGISLGRYPLAYCVSAFNFYQTSFIKFAKATLGERKKERSIRSGKEIFSSLHRRCYGAVTHEGYSCETTCDECDGLARRYNTQHATCCQRAIASAIHATM